MVTNYIMYLQHYGTKAGLDEESSHTRGGRGQADTVSGRASSRHGAGHTGHGRHHAAAAAGHGRGALGAGGGLGAVGGRIHGGHDGLVGGVAGSVGHGRDGAGAVNADALQLGALGLYGSGRGRAAVAEEGVERHTDSLDVVLSHAERGSGHADLLNKVADLVRV